MSENLEDIQHDAHALYNTACELSFELEEAKAEIDRLRAEFAAMQAAGLGDPPAD